MELISICCLSSCSETVAIVVGSGVCGEHAAEDVRDVVGLGGLCDAMTAAIYGCRHRIVSFRQIQRLQVMMLDDLPLICGL